MCEMHFQESARRDEYEALISLKISTFQGKNFSLKMRTESTVFDIKTEIFKSLLVPQKYQSLYANNILLINMRKVEQIVQELGEKNFLLPL